MTAPDDTAVPPARRATFASREFFLRVVSGVVLGAVVLGALILGGWPFALVWLAAGIVGAGEWFAISRTEPVSALTLANGAALFAMVLAILAGLSPWVAAGALALGFAAMLVLAKDATARRNAVAGLLGGAVIAVVPTVLRETPGIGLVGPAWMFAVVWSTDIAAYFTGRSMGGPKLMPRISPRKTWTGAIGGLLAGSLAGLGVVLVARSHGWDALQALPAWSVVVASAAASVVSQAGDLFESGLKRVYGVKDSGKTIPGHGGVMDRLDGFFAVAVLAGIALIVHAILARSVLPA